MQSTAARIRKRGEGGVEEWPTGRTVLLKAKQRRGHGIMVNYNEVHEAADGWWKTNKRGRSIRGQDGFCMRNI